MLKQVGITRDTDVDGIVRDDRGEPTGELAEMAAMFPVFQRIGDPFRAGRTERAVWNFARLAQAVGVTTAADLTNDLSDESVGSLQAATVREDFPLRIVAAFFGLGIDPRAGIEQVRARQRLDSAKLRFGPVKLMTDGSIQAFTARIKWPGYYDGHPNGIWNIAPAQLNDVVAAYHDAGLQLHIHVNGDEASEVTIAALGAAIARKPRPDHRHTLQHLQMADEAQFRRIRALDLCVNLFANHIYHWGDIHHDVTMGPERAHRMDAAGSALAHGFHSAFIPMRRSPRSRHFFRVVRSQPHDGVRPSTGPESADQRGERCAPSRSGRRTRCILMTKWADRSRQVRGLCRSR